MQAFRRWTVLTVTGKMMLWILLGVAATGVSRGTEATLTEVYQPTATGEEIVPMLVMCEDRYGKVGLRVVDLICAIHIPPTNAPRPADNINAAYDAGIRLRWEEDAHEKLTIEIHCEEMKAPLGPDDLKALGVTLECVRRLGKKELDKAVVRGVFKPEGQEAARKLVEAFIKHPKSKPFPWKSLF